MVLAVRDNLGLVAVWGHALERTNHSGSEAGEPRKFQSAKVLRQRGRPHSCAVRVSSVSGELRPILQGTRPAPLSSCSVTPAVTPAPLLAPGLDPKGAQTANVPSDTHTLLERRFVKMFWLPILSTQPVADPELPHDVPRSQ